MEVRRFQTREQRIAETLRKQNPDQPAEGAMTSLLRGHLMWLKEDLEKVCRPVQQQMGLDEDVFLELMGAAMITVSQELWPAEQQKCS